MPTTFKPISTETVRALQAGAPDNYGNAPERKISDGNGVPCRHCLKQIATGDAYLVVAHRPFKSLQPYAETGPIFLHAEPCSAGDSREQIPEMLDSAQYIVRGYDKDERIVYGTGTVTPTAEIPAYAQSLLADARIEFVHVRSASNNCFQCRVEGK